MIELLIALVLFAFGMLGLAGLQTRTLWYGQSSLYRSQATALADDVFDRMRADRQNARAGRWDTTLGTQSDAITGVAIYQVDLKDWKQQVETLLPSGEALISTANGIVTVKIQWDDSRGRDPVQEFVTRSRL
jgi:type IV pilus assembly protein PilV